LIGAGAQAQAGVIKVLRAAVFAFGEQAGGGLEAAVAQQDGLRRGCADHRRAPVSRAIDTGDSPARSRSMIRVTPPDSGPVPGAAMADATASRIAARSASTASAISLPGRVRRVPLVAGVARVLRLGLIEGAVGVLQEREARRPVLVG